MGAREKRTDRDQQKWKNVLKTERPGGGKRPVRPLRHELQHDKRQPGWGHEWANDRSQCPLQARQLYILNNVL